MAVSVVLENSMFFGKCKHKYSTITLTNFYGDAIIYNSTNKTIYRSLRYCKKCRKMFKSIYLDKDCPRVNDRQFVENFLEVLDEDNRTRNKSRKL